MLKIAVARLWHEAHSFTPVATVLADFKRKEWHRGPQAADFYRGTNTEIGAVVALMESEPDLDVHFSLCTAAPPAGVVPQVDMDAIHREIIAGLGGGPWDGVYVSLHGASLSSGSLSPDTDLLRKIRNLVGPDVPIAVSFDMHACINPELCDIVEILSGYHSYPHIDMFETGMRAMQMLLRSLRTRQKLRLAVRTVPMLPLSHMMRTDAGPMAELVVLAKENVDKFHIYDTTFFASFTYADSPWASAIVTMTVDAEFDCEADLDQMAAEFLARRSRFKAHFISPYQALEMAETRLKQGGEGPVCLIDTSDNPLSGGIGDTTGLLQAWLESGSQRRALFAFFHDPKLVERAFSLGEGASIEAALGGRIMPEYGAPIVLQMQIVKLTDGKFHNIGPMENGVQVDIGPSVVLQCNNLTLVISSTCQSANDPAWCALHDIDLSKIDLFLVKAKNHFRAGFAPLCRALIEVESPGPSPADLSKVPFKHVPSALIDAI